MQVEKRKGQSNESWSPGKIPCSSNSYVSWQIRASSKGQQEGGAQSQDNSQENVAAWKEVSQ